MRAFQRLTSLSVRRTMRRTMQCTMQCTIGRIALRTTPMLVNRIAVQYASTQLVCDYVDENTFPHTDSYHHQCDLCHKPFAQNQLVRPLNWPCQVCSPCYRRLMCTPVFVAPTP